jgi:hypothetical protein
VRHVQHHGLDEARRLGLISAAEEHYHYGYGELPPPPRPVQPAARRLGRLLRVNLIRDPLTARPTWSEVVKHLRLSTPQWSAMSYFATPPDIRRGKRPREQVLWSLCERGLLAELTAPEPAWTAKAWPLFEALGRFPERWSGPPQAGRTLYETLSQGGAS